MFVPILLDLYGAYNQTPAYATVNTNLEVAAEIVDRDVTLVVAVQTLEALDVHVDFILGEVNGDVGRPTAQV